MIIVTTAYTVAYVLATARPRPALWEKDKHNPQNGWLLRA